MSAYHAPLTEIRFVLRELAGLDQVGKLPGFEDATHDTVDAILEEAARFATEVLDPLNAAGDREGAQWQEGGIVRTPAGFKEAYRHFAENGWNGLTKNPEHGGQGLPQLVATAVEEMWHGANMAFALCPLLTQGAIEALELCGSDALKAMFLDKMVAGVWTGTMNLTESQAGSDLAAVRTRALPQPDGSFRVYGQKIFITYGEQDYTDNIVHLVLARTPTAPEGVKGISLFVVPKFLVDADGGLGERNDVHCVSIEHKLGIHASPTAVLAYGEKDGAVGYLVGEAHRGLEYMFIMMNAARLSVGLEGVAVAERSYQRALAWSRERLQGKPVGVQGARTSPIVQHPDVKRMLLTMKSTTEAMRALAYWTSALLDRARVHPDEAERRRAQGLVDLLIPVVKGWSTEMGIEVASLGIQVHGGMGFIEETGAAQHLRDARITTIYEGTTGIQANDLVGRKMGREEGRTALALIAEMDKTVPQLAASSDAALRAIGESLRVSLDCLRTTVAWVSKTFGTQPAAVAAGSVYVLKLMGITLGGWMMARSAQIASEQLAGGDGDAAFLKGKILTARFFAEHVMSQAPALTTAVTRGSESVLAMEEALL